MIGLLVGGTASGVGKTTVALAIIACLRRRGTWSSPSREDLISSTLPITHASLDEEHAISIPGCSCRRRIAMCCGARPLAQTPS